jgi:hemerythrin-like domain-containing protein
MTDAAAALEIDLSLLSDPLAFMEADHDRIAAVCDRLQALVNDLRHVGSDTEATALLQVLNRDLMDHIADEEDLFRMLEEDGKADDGLRSIIRVLRDEHAADHATTLAISAELRRFIAGDDMQAPAKFFVLAASYAENQRRHLTWENCTVIPAARRLLEPRELERLSTQMRDRRTRHGG